MERIFFVERDDLCEVNNLLQKGGRVKSVTPVAENITCWGHTERNHSYSSEEKFVGEIYAYVVVEFD